MQSNSSTSPFFFEKPKRKKEKRKKLEILIFLILLFFRANRCARQRSIFVAFSAQRRNPRFFRFKKTTSLEWVHFTKYKLIKQIFVFVIFICCFVCKIVLFWFHESQNVNGNTTQSSQKKKYLVSMIIPKRF